MTTPFPRPARVAARIAAIVAATLLGVGAAAALEPWQIGHGAFVSASDVTAHNRMALDIADVSAALAEGDWEEAVARFTYGGNFPNHSLALFSDDYNGRFRAHLPQSVEHFGSTTFLHHALYAGLAGSGPLRGRTEPERIAFLEAGLQAAALNWSRYELGESQRKALMAEPNWSLENGSPKNWNEIFAFYYGPDGAHSSFEAVGALEGGAALNDALFASLAAGQEILVTEQWAEDDAAAVDAHLDRASVLLFAAALDVPEDAAPEALGEARAAARGYWLAAAEALSPDGDVVAAYDALVAADAEALADPLAALREAVAPHLDD
jgi:hypothetical protein